MVYWHDICEEKKLRLQKKIIKTFYLNLNLKSTSKLQTIYSKISDKKSDHNNLVSHYNSHVGPLYPTSDFFFVLVEQLYSVDL